MIELRRFDPSRYLRSSEEIRDFLTVAAEGNDPQHLTNAQTIAKRALDRLNSSPSISDYADPNRRPPTDQQYREPQISLQRLARSSR